MKRLQKFQAVAFVCACSGVAWSQTPREPVGALPDGGPSLNSGWTLRPAGTQIAVGSFPMSAVASKDGRYLLVMNAGATPSISVVDARAKTELSRTPVKDAWLGLAMNPAGDRLYAGGGAEAAVFEFSFANGRLTPTRKFPVVDAAKRTARDFIGDLCFSPDGRMLYAADLFHDSLVIINPLTGFIVDHVKTGRRPYRVLFAPDGNSYFVTSWADGSLSRYQTTDNSMIGSVRLGAHPTDMVWRHSDTGDKIYVAVANTNSVYGVNVPESGELTRAEAINLSLSAEQPLGITPSALALSPDAKTLYVVCSDSNAVAQVDLSGTRAVVSGFIPVGEYPAAVRTLGDGTIAVANARTPGSPYGTVSVIAPPDSDQLDQDSSTVVASSGYSDAKLMTGVQMPAAIKHVIYVVNGGAAPGRGPNLQKLAQEFVLLDNFYALGETLADGLNWSTAAIASDFVEKLSPAFEAGRSQRNDFEGGEPAAFPPAGYLWNNAHLAGISVRNYGFWVTNQSPAGADGAQVQAVRDPQLAAVTDMRYRGNDAAYSDHDRAREFIRELHGFEQSGSMPQLSLIRMDGDHDNDAALGMLADALTKSKLWADTAVFIVQAGSGAGGGEAPRRSPAWVISPYVRRHSTDSTRYNTASVLRTIEWIFGMRPMTQFDAAATAMSAPVQNTPDTTPFSVVNGSPAP